MRDHLCRVSVRDFSAADWRRIEENAERLLELSRMEGLPGSGAFMVMARVQAFNDYAEDVLRQK